MPPTRSRRLLLAFVILVALGAGLAVLRPWQQHGPAPRIATARIDRGTISAQVTATGTLSPRKLVTVSSQISGRLSEVLVDYNDPVVKGQVMARLDTELLQAQLEQANASLAVAQATLAKLRVSRDDAELTYSRQERLAGDRLVAAADLQSALTKRDLARAEIAAQEAQVRQARASAQQVKTNLGYAAILSPVDGTVISRSVDVGQTVAASLQAPTLFTIAEDLRRMQIDTSVAEGDIGRLEAGMKALFNVDAFPGKEFAGVVRQIRNAATIAQNVVTYDVVIDVDNPDRLLRPSMTANVAFVITEIADAVRLPNAAMRFSPTAEQLQATAGSPAGGTPSSGAPGGPPPGGGPVGGGPPLGGPPPGPGVIVATRRSEPADQRVVWKLVDGKPRSTHVTIGLSDGSRTQLVEGELDPGDELVTEISGVERKLKLPGAF
jgi:HlyD family secretion protein